MVIFLLIVMDFAMDFLKATCLQSEFWHEVFGGLRISYEKCSEIFPEIFEP